MSSFRLFYLSLFCIKIQTIAKEYMGKDWRTIKFRRDHSIQLKKNAYCVFICQRTNLPGECQHAVCQECHEEHSKAQKRSRGGVPSEKELMMSCHHELRNLQLCATFGGVPKIILNIISSQSVSRAVRSVRECSL